MAVVASAKIGAEQAPIAMPWTLTRLEHRSGQKPMNPMVYAQRIDRAHWAMIFCTPREPTPAAEVAMGMKRWQPAARVTEVEKRLMKIAGRSRKLFVFLREHRHELFDAAFQDELEDMYRQTDQGEEPRPPALMCMALLVQGYMQVSHAGLGRRGR